MPNEEITLKENNYYEFFIGIKDIDKRVYNNRIILFWVYLKTIKEIKPEDFIEKRKRLYTDISTELANGFRKTIKTLSSEINREPETFIYELLQNADDYADPVKRLVDVKFTITASYLLLTHNGQPFNYLNVYALTGISQGDKRDKIDAIGFKGIGFKSIFKHSNFVIIKSGGFSFKFDESAFPKTAQRPWQVIPIWIEQYDEELSKNNDFISAPVSIAIKPTIGNEQLRKTEKSYLKILQNVFRDDRILIFLRRIETVTITDALNEDIRITLNKNKEKWFISSGLKDIDVSIDVKEWLNKQIDNEEITIPEKYYDITKTKITFAVQRSGTKLIGTTNSKIYNYLPTEIDFGFLFLINGDFIPDGSRTELHNNEWNHFLAFNAGYKFVEWLISLGQHNWSYNKNFDKDYIALLPDFKDPKATNAGKNTFFLESFLKGFKLAVLGENEISALAFIPSDSNTLETLETILVDETGIVELLGENVFSNLTGIICKPLHKEVGVGVSL